MGFMIESLLCLLRERAWTRGGRFCYAPDCGSVQTNETMGRKGSETDSHLANTDMNNVDIYWLFNSYIKLL